MRDKLEGDRPADMDGVSLAKKDLSGHRTASPITETKPKRIHYVLGWLLAAVVLALLIRNVEDRMETAPTGRNVAEQRRGVPEREYVSSTFEPVVIAEFTPSESNGDEEYAAKVHLIGKDGMEMSRRLPIRCDNGPIEARVLRAIRIRTDTWRLRGGGEERLISEDDAEAALCGDFSGRDVARTPQSIDQNLKGTR